MKKIFMILLNVLFCLMMSVTSFAVNTTTIGSSTTTVEITGLDADWVWVTDMTAANYEEINTVKITAIVFYPSAAGDRMIIRDGGVDAATYFDSGIVTGSDDPRWMMYPKPTKVPLVIDISDCTLGTAANAKVVIYLEKQ